MRSSPPANTARRLVVVRELMTNFTRCGLRSEVFRAYEDKVRLRTVLEGYETLAEESLPPIRLRLSVVARQRSMATLLRPASSKPRAWASGVIARELKMPPSSVY
jgi:hypothetical protein